MNNEVLIIAAVIMVPLCIYVARRTWINECIKGGDWVEYSIKNYQKMNDGTMQIKFDMDGKEQTKTIKDEGIHNYIRKSRDPRVFVLMMCKYSEKRYALYLRKYEYRKTQ